ncbi:PP2C family serine/threonine-protein phosphatase [Kitasatospora sp. NPDC098663]|uniref:PP2C family serine/threonine-protein phosphatase n=1 Tax=Kitasatospora sp. NPDC098663 TaxID=3364096 RepID=UPI003818CA95
MTGTQLTGVLTAVATAAGTTGISGDAAYVYTLADGTTAACVVDGIGHSAQITERAALLAEVGARIAATRGPLHGLLTAAELISDPGPEDLPEEDAVAAAAVAHLDRAEFSLAWTGDCAAWSYDPDTEEVMKLTTDHTMGQFLRQVHPGGPPARAEHHDDWVRVSLARSSIATVREAESNAPLVVLASDGVHKPLGDRFPTLVRSLADAGPQRLADGLLQGALLCAADQRGETDDATVVVLARR